MLLPTATADGPRRGARRPATLATSTTGGGDVGWILGIPFWAGFVLGVIVTLIVTAIA